MFKTWDAFTIARDHNGGRRGNCRVCAHEKYILWKTEHPDQYQDHLINQGEPGRKARQRALRVSRLETVDGRLGVLLDAARYRSIQKGLPFDLDLSFLRELWDQSSGACSMTGIVFDLTMKDKRRGGWRSFSPCIDRRDSTQGYTRDNVRIICNEMNVALGNRGDAVFERIARGYIAKLDADRMKKAA